MPYLTADADISRESQMNCEIINSIDNDREELIAFLLSFLRADNSVATPAVTASEIIIEYLAKRGIRTVAIAPLQNDQPNITSLFNRSDGPCLVMSGLLPASSAPSSIHCKAVSEDRRSSFPKSKMAYNAGIAATVAAYACLHAHQKHIDGTVVLITISDDELGSRGGLQNLLYRDERRGLFRGDCVLDSSHTRLETAPRGTVTEAVHAHALEETVLRHARVIFGKEVAPLVATVPTYCDIWRKLGIPTFSYGLASVESLADADSVEDYISLIKVHALAAWDYMHLEDCEQ